MAGISFWYSQCLYGRIVTSASNPVGSYVALLLPTSEPSADPRLGAHGWSGLARAFRLKAC